MFLEEQDSPSSQGKIPKTSKEFIRELFNSQIVVVPSFMTHIPKT